MRGIQQGLLPRKAKGSVDPDAPLGMTRYARPAGSATAMPSESYQYDIVYDAFCVDTEFWDHWKVVACARSSLEQSVSQDNASIRVVLNLEPSQRLFPTAYTPGLPTLPFGVGDVVPQAKRCTWVVRDAVPEEELESMAHYEDPFCNMQRMQEWCEKYPDCAGFMYNTATGEWTPKRRCSTFDAGTAVFLESQSWQFLYIKERAEARREREIPGLPKGYSVALDVHILKEARIMLAHQRSFRGGQIDPKYEWLDKIVRNHDGEEGRPCPRAKQKSSRPRMLTDEVRPESELRPPIGSLPLDCSKPGLTDGLTSFTDDYAGQYQVMKHVCQGREQVYQENTLINAFGGSDQKLPPRENGSWSGPPKKSHIELEREFMQGLAMDRKLDDMLHRTTGGGHHHHHHHQDDEPLAPLPAPAHRSGDGLLGGRLDR